jgi:hypothetical protein
MREVTFPSSTELPKKRRGFRDKSVCAEVGVRCISQGRIYQKQTGCLKVLRVIKSLHI